MTEMMNASERKVTKATHPRTVQIVSHPLEVEIPVIQEKKTC